MFRFAPTEYLGKCNKMNKGLLWDTCQELVRDLAERKLQSIMVYQCKCEGKQKSILLRFMQGL